MRVRTILFATLLVILVGLNVYQYRAPKPEPSDQEVIERFQGVFVKAWPDFDLTWFGIKTLQHPFDVWVTQEIIFEVKPDVIVETGTFLGGSATLWASILEHANPEGRVITIDGRNWGIGVAQRLPLVQRRVDFLSGSSTDPKIVSDVARRVKGKKVLVILDSRHVKNHVLKEIKAYAPLVSVGSYIIVQDTDLGRRFPFWYLEQKWLPGPMDAVEEFLSSTDEFVIDTSREKLLVTNNRNGFLKRIR